MDDLDLLIDLHVGNHRQGPGGDDETRLAIRLAGLTPGDAMEIADIGCGTGASSLVLARDLGARVTAVDTAAAFVERLAQRADGAGLGSLISPRIGDMRALPFREGQFDAIWSEGSAYHLGFGDALRTWRPFLRPGGVVAVSELTWTTAQRPEEIDRYWVQEYPGIGLVSEKLVAMERAGFRPRGFFFLPASCWTEAYYGPLRAGFAGFLERHGSSKAARRVVESEISEIRLYERYGEWYGYGFYIAERLAD